MATLTDGAAQERWQKVATQLLPLEAQIEDAYNEAAQAGGVKLFNTPGHASAQSSPDPAV
jgi:hypothetical protein